jgi:hypothetical protein
MSGGSLVQHVTGHAINGTHKIHLMNEEVDIDITSTHHQMMWPFGLDKKDYSILAKSMHDLSKTYLNGDNREKRLPADFIEPEIVYYNKTNCLCIQGHPEYMPKDSVAVKYINVLIKEYLEDTVEIVPDIIEEELEVLNINDEILRQRINGNIIDNRINWDNRGVQLNNIEEPNEKQAQAENPEIDQQMNDFDRFLLGIR